MTDQQQTHREAVRILFEEVWNRRQFDNFAARVATPVTMHFHGHAFSTNIDELRELVDYWHGAFSDLHYQIDHMLAEDNIVAVRLTITGQHTGTYEGIAATGREIRVSEMMFFRFESGLIVEMWEVYDEFALRQQLERHTPEDL